jgi:hypothetical protein
VVGLLEFVQKNSPAADLSALTHEVMQLRDDLDRHIAQPSNESTQSAKLAFSPVGIWTFTWTPGTIKALESVWEEFTIGSAGIGQAVIVVPPYTPSNVVFFVERVSSVIVRITAHNLALTDAVLAAGAFRVYSFN